MMLRVIAVVIKHPVSDDGSFFLFDSTVATPVFFAERDWRPITTSLVTERRGFGHAYLASSHAW